jgi:choline transporter-like protein 2/4/5
MGACLCLSNGGTEKDATTVFQPASVRSCWNNFAFLLLFVASWAGLLAILVLAAQQGGTPYRITRGMNWKGQLCGIDATVRALPYAAWIAMPSSLGIDPAGDECTDCYQIMTCLSTCNETLTSSFLVDHYESKSFLHHCIPKTLSSSFPYGSELQSAETVASQAFADLYVTWPVILTSVLIALTVSFFYTMLTRFYAGYVLAVSVILTIAGGIMISVVLLKTARSYEFPDAREGLNLVTGRYYTLRALGIVSVILTALFILFVVIARRQLYIASILMKEASKVFMRVPHMVTFVIFPGLCTVAYFVLFVFITIMLSTVWTSSIESFPPYILTRAPTYASETRVQFSFNTSLKNAFAYVFMHMLWSTQFLVHYSYMVIAAVVSRWYFTRSPTGKSKDKPISGHAVLHAVYMVSRFHLGTVAFASLLAALLRFMRFVMLYLDAQIKNGTCGSWLPACVRDKIMCCSQTVLAALQFIVARMNEQAFIWSATWGDSLCASAENVAHLIARNLGSCAIMGLVGTYFSLLGKIFIASITTGISALIAQKLYAENTDVSSVGLTIAIIFIASYVAASITLNVLSTSLDTIFMCYLMDAELNSQNPDAMYASATLQKVIRKTLPSKLQDQKTSSKEMINPRSAEKANKKVLDKKKKVEMDSQVHAVVEQPTTCVEVNQV